MAMQTFGSSMGIPLISELPATAAYATLDADGEAMAHIVQIPKSGTLTQVAFGTNTVTTGDDNFSVRLETVDGATGDPSGTLYAANASGTVDIADTDDNKIIVCNINSGTGVSVTKGDVVALRLERPTSGAFNGRISYSDMGPSSGFAYTDTYASSAWTKGTGGKPCCAFNIGGWLLPHGAQLYSTISSEAINDPGDAEERGLCINLPFKARLCGVLALIAAAAGENYRFVLYSDPTGTPDAELTGDDIDADLRASPNARWVRYMFDTQFVLAANTPYVLALQPTTANEIGLSYIEHGVNTYAAAMPYGAEMTWYARNDTGAFAETDTRIPCIIPLFDQFDDGASTGGAGPVFGDRTGGLR